MATSLLRFQGKAFWIHNAVAEVWLSAFVEELRIRNPSNEWAMGLGHEIAEALESKWIDGIVMTAFDAHLADEVRIRMFLPLMQDVSNDLLTKARSASVVTVHDFDADSSFLIPEIGMLMKLFAQPDMVPVPAHIFVPNEGWRIA